MQAMDWPVLYRRLGSADVVRKTLESLLRHHGDTPARLHELAASDDVEAVRSIAHNLRGICGLLEAIPTRLAAEALDNQIRTDAALDPVLVETLARVVAKLVADVQDHLAAN